VYRDNAATPASRQHRLGWPTRSELCLRDMTQRGRQVCTQEDERDVVGGGGLDRLPDHHLLRWLCPLQEAKLRAVVHIGWPSSYTKGFIAYIVATRSKRQGVLSLLLRSQTVLSTPSSHKITSNSVIELARKRCGRAMPPCCRQS